VDDDEIRLLQYVSGQQGTPDLKIVNSFTVALTEWYCLPQLSRGILTRAVRLNARQAVSGILAFPEILVSHSIPSWADVKFYHGIGGLGLSRFT
jgi:hypothetical protein